MPALFIGHGSPLNAIEDNAWSRSWRALGEHLPQPRAILCISAHWLTRNGTAVTAMAAPPTIHDFGGFPQKLFDQQYPAPGDPQLAAELVQLLQNNPDTAITPDQSWGLDHGTWSVLLPMFPKADIPVLQLSLDYDRPGRFHYELGVRLRALRDKGVLILGSGNIVHNLRALRADDQTYDWALEFDQVISQAVERDDWQTAVDFQALGEVARLAHPTYDHYLPLLYTLGVKDKTDRLVWFNQGFTRGAISMRSLMLV
jgi:4,5-DOPA dioxygenase extradiol